MLRSAWITLFLLYCGEVLSQRYPFINYTPIDGLVNNNIRSIRQDSRGRLFFSTRGGLSIYDGARFTNYTTADGLAQDFVNDVLEITPDSFWVATNTGALNCLVRQQIKTIHTADGFCPLINNFFRGSNGVIYVGGDVGLFKWDKDRFQKLRVNDGEVNAEFIYDIKQVGNFLILCTNPGFGSDRGAIFVYDFERQKTVSHYNQTRTSAWVTAPSGDIWISSSDGIKRLKKEDLERGIFRKESIPTQYASAQNEHPSYLAFDKLGRLWLGIPAIGLRSYEPGKEVIEYNESSALVAGRINFIFNDREGNNWFVLEGYGVQKLVSTSIALMNHPFGQNSICDLFAQPGSDSLWACVAYPNRLMLVSGGSKKEFDPGFIPRSAPKLAVKGSTIFFYENSIMRCYELPVTGNKLRKICEYQYPSLETGTATVDVNGNLLFCTSSTLRVFFKDCSVFNYPLDYFVDQLCFDEHGVLWTLSRSGKLVTLTLHPEDRQHYLQLHTDLSSKVHIENPRGIVIDKQQRVWIATRYKGISCYQIEGDNLKLLYHVDTRNGLSDNFINYLECNAGAIWASSPAGLDKLYFVNGQLVIENVTQSNKIFATLRKVVFDKSGNAWALAEAGNILRIKADGIQQTPEPPQFFISSIQAGDRSYAANDSLLSLHYDQNNIIFFAAAPSYYAEKEIRYSYLLQGSANTRWSEPITDAAFHFENLQPGKYIMNMKAIFPAGKYSPEFIRFPFTINPPWWQTWWWRSIFTLVFVALMVLMVRKYYRSKLLKQTMLLEKQQAVEKERTRIATDMHDDLGAGLSRIKYLSESIQLKKGDDPSIMGEVQKIATYSDEMVEKMGEIVWALNEKNDTLDHLLSFTRSYASDYLATNNIICDFTFPEELPESFVTGEVRRNIFLSVKEGLHNVVKHASAQTVTIKATIDPNLKISIHDDGVGIDWKNIRQFSNGLSNISRRMEEIGGKAEFHNSAGTEIVLDVPVTQ